MPDYQWDFYENYEQTDSHDKYREIGDWTPSMFVEYFYHHVYQEYGRKLQPQWGRDCSIIKQVQQTASDEEIIACIEWVVPKANLMERYCNCPILSVKIKINEFLMKYYDQEEESWDDEIENW